MRRKILLIVMISLLIIMGGLFVKRVYEDKAKSAEEEISTIVKDFETLNSKLMRYDIKKSGKLDISANYKGAHGENFPHDFVFNYQLKGNTIYFENKDGYNTINLNNDIIKIIHTLTKSFDVASIDIKNRKVKFATLTADIDPKYLNDALSTNFKNIHISVDFANVLSREIAKTIIRIDDITIIKERKQYKIEYKDHKISFNYNKSGYSIAIDNNIKMNAFNETTDDRYNIVIDSYVFSLALDTNGLELVATTGASIYNSLTIKATYEENELSLKERINTDENPITRYFSDVKFK